ncbi:hypothetical protein, partial [Klebsiella pneumoniae]|uniref:hypothetical protein n=1 Tax=Klebsiella pneumoniae TaxID=573 RepID=UPI0009837944
VCVVGWMRDLILQLSKSSIYSTKPISVKTGNNARNGGKNSLNRLIRLFCGKKIGPDPRNFNQRVSLGRNDLLIRTFLSTLRFIFYDDLSVTIAAVHQAKEPHAVNLSLEENIL